MKNSHIYPGAHTMNAYVILNDCAKAIDFYKKAFNAKELGRLTMPDGKIAHAEITIEGTMLMMSDENKEWGHKSLETIGDSPVSFGIYVKDCDAVFKNAIEAGATQVMEVQDQFYGDRTGQVKDPFGLKWTIGTHQESLAFDEMQKRMEKLFS